MNKTLVKALQKQEQQQKRFLEIGVDQIFKDIYDRSSERATRLLAEGSIHLSMGLYRTEEDIEKIRQRAEKLRLENEQYPLSKSFEPASSRDKVIL